MSDFSGANQHIKPFVVETLTSKALHFSICEIQSRMRLDDADGLDLDYTRLMMGFLLFSPKPSRIAMIGLGGGSLAKFCFRHLPEADIEVVEINPHVVALRDSFHVPEDNARFRVVLEDGARFVRERASDLDVLLVDGFDEQGQPSRLASQAFYDDCCDSLADSGMMVVNLHSGHRRHEVHLERLCRAFDNRVLLVQSADEGNTVAFAFRDATPLARRAEARCKPVRLDATGASTLKSAFAAVERGLRDQREPHP